MMFMKVIILSVTAIVAVAINSCVHYQEACNVCKNGNMFKLIIKNITVKTNSVISIDTIEYR